MFNNIRVSVLTHLYKNLIFTEGSISESSVEGIPAHVKHKECLRRDTGL